MPPEDLRSIFSRMQRRGTGLGAGSGQAPGGQGEVASASIHIDTSSVEAAVASLGNMAGAAEQVSKNVDDSVKSVSASFDRLKGAVNDATKNMRASMTSMLTSLRSAAGAEFFEPTWGAKAAENARRQAQAGLDMISRLRAEAFKTPGMLYLTDVGKQMEAPFRGALSNMQRALADFGSASRNTLNGLRSAFKSFGASVSDVGHAFTRMRWGLLGLSLIAPAGFQAAQSIAALNIGLQAMGTSLDEIRQISQEAGGLPFVELAEGARTLLPMIRRYNADLKSTLILQQQLAVLNPAQGLFGAGIAIAEFLAGQWRSLTMRFNLSISDMRKIFQQAGGDVNKAVKGLSDYLGQVGISADLIRDMAEEGVYAFALLRDELKVLLADMFGPALKEFVLPAVRQIIEFIEALREANPELLEIAGAILSIVAAVSALGLALGPIINLLSGLGSIIAIGGLPGLAMIGAGVVSILALAESEQITFGEALEKTVVQLADTVGNFAASVMEWINEIGAALQKLGLAKGPELSEAQEREKKTLEESYRRAKEAINSLGALSALHGPEAKLGEIPFGVGDIKALERLFGFEQAGLLTGVAEEMQRQMFGKTFREMTVSEAYALVQKNVGAIEESLKKFYGQVIPQSEIDAARNFDVAVQEFIDSFKKDVQKATDAIKHDMTGLGPTLLEPTEEMLDAFADMQADLQRITDEANEQIRKIREDAYIREQQELEDHQEKLADVQDDARQEQLEDDARFARERARKLRDYYIDLLEAASRLDAYAVRNILRRMKEDQQREDEDRKERKEKREQELRDRLKQEQDDFEKRRQRQREEDNRRIRDILENAEAERALRRQKFAEQYNELAQEAGWHNALMLDIARTGYAQLREEFVRYLLDMGASARSLINAGMMDVWNPAYRQYIPYELPANYYTPTPAPSWVYSPSGTSNVTVAPGAVQINASNLSANQVASAVVDVFQNIMTTLGGLPSSLRDMVYSSSGSGFRRPIERRTGRI